MKGVVIVGAQSGGPGLAQLVGELVAGMGVTAAQQVPDDLASVVAQGGVSLSFFPCKPRMTDGITLSQRQSSWEEDDQRVQSHFPARRSGP
ncbi:MAG: hypothetical protein WCF33_13590, partial [Pseudonocardiaceae bacterium]